MNKDLIKTLLEEDDPTEPTKPMLDHFYKRTGEHISRVQKNMEILANNLEGIDKEAFEKRAADHDHTKYDEYEKEYIWLSWWFANNKNDDIYPYPEYKDVIWKATGGHIHDEKHHPQAWSNVKDMSEIYLAEMVSDWYAMSQELGTDIYDWMEKNMPKWDFSEEQVERIYDMMEILAGSK